MCYIFYFFIIIESLSLKSLSMPNVYLKNWVKNFDELLLKIYKRDVFVVNIIWFADPNDEVCVFDLMTFTYDHGF